MAARLWSEQISLNLNQGSSYRTRSGRRCQLGGCAILILMMVASVRIVSAQSDISYGSFGPPVQQESEMIFDAPAQGTYSPTELFIDDGGPVVAGRSESFLNLSPAYSREMLDFQNRQTNKEILLLQESQNNQLYPQLTLGAQFRVSGLYAKTNRANKFSYLGRFPTDFEGQYASDFRMLQANQSGSLSFGPKVHAYFETLYSDVFSFSDFKQGSFQVRQIYVVFGDFSQSPWYAYIGKKNVGFGDMGTLSPFTQAMPWHYFAPLAEGAGLGYDNGTVNATITALNGSRGIRVVDSEAKGDVNNFAANLLFRLPMRNGSEFHIGAGYLQGTIYNASVAEHLNPDLVGPNNGAFDFNAYLRVRKLHLAAEYVQTDNPWPVTDHEVIAYRTEAAYDSCFGTKPARWSLSWSEGLQGPAGSEFEFNRQIVVGYQVEASQHATFSIEYVRSSGFAPLIAIERVSDIDVIQDSIVFGGTLTL